MKRLSALALLLASPGKFTFIFFYDFYPFLFNLGKLLTFIREEIGAASSIFEEGDVVGLATPCMASPLVSKRS